MFYNVCNFRRPDVTVDGNEVKIVSCMDIYVFCIFITEVINVKKNYFSSTCLPSCLLAIMLCMRRHFAGCNGLRLIIQGWQVWAPAGAEICLWLTMQWTCILLKERSCTNSQLLLWIPKLAPTEQDSVFNIIPHLKV